MRRRTSERIISNDRLPEPMTMEARNSTTCTPDARRIASSVDRSICKGTETSVVPFQKSRMINTFSNLPISLHVESPLVSR